MEQSPGIDGRRAIILVGFRATGLAPSRIDVGPVRIQYFLAPDSTPLVALGDSEVALGESELERTTNFGQPSPSHDERPPAIYNFDMADSSTVNAQITDSVTQTNVETIGLAPGTAVAMLYQATAQALGNSAHNATTNQQNADMVFQSITTTNAAIIASLAPKS